MQLLLSSKFSIYIIPTHISSLVSAHWVQLKPKLDLTKPSISTELLLALGENGNIFSFLPLICLFSKHEFIGPKHLKKTACSVL